MKHLKKHPINDKSQKLSKDMKKQDLVKPISNKKLDADDSLSDPEVESKYRKPSNKKLSGEKHLSDVKINKRFTKPNSKKMDGEKFLAEKFSGEHEMSPYFEEGMDKLYSLIRDEIMNSKDIEDFYEAEFFIQEKVSKYLISKLWSDDELSDFMKKKELGEDN